MRENLQQTGKPGFSTVEVERTKNILPYIGLKKAETLSSLKRKFIITFREHDRRRGTDFLKTFPEYKEFWSSCEKERSSDHKKPSPSRSTSL
jgi:hypothetical protein